MKIFVTVIALLVFTSFSVQKTGVAHAGTGDAILLVAVIGGAAYVGFHFSQNYEIKKKAALNIKEGKLAFQRPTLQLDRTEKNSLSEKKDLYSLALVNLDF